ncbi:DUF5018 domain-containing protein [Reichenbachiella agariperforans]|uniref:DUF5018 domain-containing protein n=1 Tax=Reichenbachiella agariperforans TaxID=156994 RepID=UPI001C09702E|nr:DUF5018 domain-containing protein [Reichenbachiella agariperforans]MBU2912842.1 DUF5018 domain-containing protein [Reichenbachiella agariperforans]
MRKIHAILALAALVIGFTSCSEDDSPSFSSLNDIESFEIDFGGIEGVTYDFGTDIEISVPFGTDLSGLVPTIVVSENATVTPESGSAVDFTDGEATVFTVTAENTVDVATYNVIITTRGEVGSGSKLKTYQLVELYLENSVTTYEYSETSGFVTKYTKVLDDLGTEITSTYELVYDEKNQVIEEIFTSGDIEGSTVYEYVDGVIVAAEYTEGTESIYSYTYSYSSESGYLTTVVRVDHTDEDFESRDVYMVDENGNVTTQTISNQVQTAGYDDKHNPFRSLYPAAYAAINIGIGAVNTNNPISGTLVDDGGTFEYNTDDYPLSADYTYYDGFITVSKVYTYFE